MIARGSSSHPPFGLDLVPMMLVLLMAGSAALAQAQVPPPAPLLHSSGALSMTDRVAAQEAIERVFYEMGIWPEDNPEPKVPFEKAVPREVIERKVERYLKESAALQEYWQRPMTSQGLQAEMDRMAAHTKDAAGLRKLFAALNNDPRLIAECLARPILADRLARESYAADERIHGELKREAEALREKLTPANFAVLGGFKYHPIHILRRDFNKQEALNDPHDGVQSLPSQEFEKPLAEFPGEGRVSPVTETAGTFLIRWTQTKGDAEFAGGVIAFPKEPFEEWFLVASSSLNVESAVPQASYSLLEHPAPLSQIGVWTPIATSDAPESGYCSTAVWTGTEMIVWGGWGEGALLLDTGGRYNPSSNSWLPTSTWTVCPTARGEHEVGAAARPPLAGALSWPNLGRMRRVMNNAAAAGPAPCQTLKVERPCCPISTGRGGVACTEEKP